IDGRQIGAEIECTCVKYEGIRVTRTAFIESTTEFPWCCCTDSLLSI
ncbi:unnamed protein product, partial [Rotaria sp. Silwood2]